MWNWRVVLDWIKLNVMYEFPSSCTDQGGQGEQDFVHQGQRYRYDQRGSNQELGYHREVGYLM